MDDKDLVETVPKINMGVETPRFEETSGSVLKGPLIGPKYPSAFAAFKPLAGVSSSLEIGGAGPVIASRAAPEHTGQAEYELYPVPFGRDSLTAALLLYKERPNLAKATIWYAASIQGNKENDASEEEVGRIFHEDRKPGDPKREKITREQGWGWPFYGSVDATLLFIQAIVLVAKDDPEFLNTTFQRRDDQKEYTVRFALDQALDWVLQKTKKTEENPEGLLEFKRRNPNGIENQVWKDSGDSYFHSDGTIANHNRGIASIEVQTLAYDALLDAADLLVNENTNSNKAQLLRNRAHDLGKEILDKFWVEDERGGYFALGTDRDANGQLQVMKIRTSNMGWALNSRLLEGNDPDIISKREALIRTLFSDEMLAAAGIRTLSKLEKRYRAGAYHNGSVWPFDIYIIAQGLERHGYFGFATDLERRLLKVIEETQKYPEFVRGEDDKIVLNTKIIDEHDPTLGRINRFEQPPQDIQAFTVATALAEKFARNPLKPTLKSSIALDWHKRQLELELLHQEKLAA